MALYSLRCWDCGSEIDRYAPMTSPKSSTACSCGSVMVRRYTPPATLRSQTFEPHYNHSVGAFVQSRRDFTDALKRGSDEASEVTGVTHNYRPADPRDIPQPGDVTHREKLDRDSGRTVPTKTIIT